MSAIPFITSSASGLDLSSRLVVSKAVVGSPATNAQTIVASITVNSSVAVESGILLFGWVAYTVGTSGVSGALILRQTGTSGSVIATSGAVTEIAANLSNRSIVGFDTGPTLPGQVYVMTLTIGSGAAVSTVSAVCLAALVV